jgi:hypothetical protein
MIVIGLFASNWHSLQLQNSLLWANIDNIDIDNNIYNNIDNILLDAHLCHISPPVGGEIRRAGEYR